MKKIILLAALAVISCNVFAQDIITKKDATEIEAKVVKVGTSEIEYKQWNNIDGPIYTIPVNEVFTIKYENGQRDVLSQLQTASDKYENRSISGANKEFKPHYEGDVVFGYSLNVNNSFDMTAFETVHGVRINPYLFVGVGAGLYFAYDIQYVRSTNNKGNIVFDRTIGYFVPVFTELKGYYPFSNMFSIYASVDLGALVNTGVGKGDVNKVGASFYGAFGPGIQVGKHRVKFDFSPRYQYLAKKNGAMLFRFGINF